MIIYYQDNIGIIERHVDFINGIQFLDGFAYFTVDFEEYKIPVNALVEIVWR